MSVELDGDGVTACPVWIELERRTNAQKVASKLQRYSGHYLRHLEEEDECVIRPVLIVHFDHRTDMHATRTPDTGASGLSVRVRERLLSEGRDNHFLELDRKLLDIDDSLDPARLFAVCDWWTLHALDFSAPLFALSTYPAAASSSSNASNGECSRADPVGFREVIREWAYTVGSVERWLEANTETP